MKTKTTVLAGNKALAGTGFQMYPVTATLPTSYKVRVENESGDFVANFRSYAAALKRYVPNGCGGKTRKQLEKLFV